MCCRVPASHNSRHRVASAMRPNYNNTRSFQISQEKPLITHLHSKGSFKKRTNTRSQHVERVIMALKVSSRRVDVVGKEVVGSTQQKLSVWTVCVILCHYIARWREQRGWFSCALADVMALGQLRLRQRGILYGKRTKHDSLGCPGILLTPLVRLCIYLFFLLTYGESSSSADAPSLTC